MNLRLLSVSKMFIDECVGMSVKDLILMIFFFCKRRLCLWLFVLKGRVMILILDN